MNRWAVNDPEQLARVLDTLERVRQEFNSGGDARISLADLIVLGGVAVVERAASDTGFATGVPFTPGRTDASAEQTDASGLAWLEPAADGFRNHRGPAATAPTQHLLVERARLLTLSAPEMTVLVGASGFSARPRAARRRGFSPTRSASSVPTSSRRSPIPTSPELPPATTRRPSPVAVARPNGRQPGRT